MQMLDAIRGTEAVVREIVSSLCLSTM